jgi:hypothetical protein
MYNSTTSLLKTTISGYTTSEILEVVGNLL